MQNQEHCVVVKNVLRWGHGSGVVSSVEAILRPSGRGVDWSNVGVVHLCIQYSGWQVKIVVLDHGRERRKQMFCKKSVTK